MSNELHTIVVLYFFMFLDVNECDSSPCQNGGTCVDEIYGYTCQCTDAWFGDTCAGIFSQ